MFISSHNDTEQAVQNRELARIIEAALSKLSFDYRMVFSLREINGLTVSETAGLLHISESNVKIRLNRAKAMLRTEIEKKHAASELFEFNRIYCNAMVTQVMKKIKEF